MEEGEEAAGGLREIGNLASWSVTSAKPGNGVELLRDGDAATFWQSDGVQPHLITAQFEQRVELLELHLLLDFKLDESYTPNKLVVRAGTGCHDLKDIAVLDLKEPSGWMKTDLWHLGPGQQVVPLRAFCLQVAILSNHQNGRDTHVRGVRVLGPRPHPQSSLGFPLSLEAHAAAGPYATVR
ncbi:anaphase-promoting complex subunit [Raphidocelis subcapitata]|uniref:Anaphase-promoting complex subunit 10 n=1 Tax=Raphidocelis subcapitata TaxID=307507 RepID=A0A2V0P7L6_9CHLO|nr:anaphase-promoting complex subunit [Raphidocelis subcapitata]|eukprot:GBF95858.1 anaphase-promoting complex subunit [Raphidocelis subcapitata]